MSAKVERARHVVEHGRDLFPHECFWAAEHVRFADGEMLGPYRHADTCAHGFSVRHKGFRRVVLAPPEPEEVSQHEINTRRRLGR